MEVKIIRENCVKPSSLTPSHLKIYKVSLFDQFMGPVYYSVAYFYPNSINSQHRSLLLKSSLSNTLSRYYPLAGKIKDYVSIDCNDEGTYYADAIADIPISEYLAKPDLSILNKLVPDPSSSYENITGAFVLMIQETTFSCGGLALGFTASHIALDGTGFLSFVKHWASRASSTFSTPLRQPYMDSPLLFPIYLPFPKEAHLSNLWSPFAKRRKVAVQRVVFDRHAIHKLKSMTTSKSVKNPTKVEVVSAVISKSLKAALNAKSIVIIHSVNFRGKATPVIPDCSMGNHVWPTQTICSDEKIVLSSLVDRFRNAKRKIDNKFYDDVKQLGFGKLFKDVKEMSSRLYDYGMESINISSSCNSSMYNDSDFGWGKAIWVSHCTLADSQETTFSSICMMNDTRGGDGVEAWLYVSRDVADTMEKDDELLQYASFNPSALNWSITLSSL